MGKRIMRGRDIDRRVATADFVGLGYEALPQRSLLSCPAARSWVAVAGVSGHEACILVLDELVGWTPRAGTTIHSEVGRVPQKTHNHRAAGLPTAWRMRLLLCADRKR